MLLPETTPTETKPSPSGNRLAQGGVRERLAVPIVIPVSVRLIPESIARSATFPRPQLVPLSLLRDLIRNRYRPIIRTVFFMNSLFSVSDGRLLWKLHRPVSLRYAMAVLGIIWHGSCFALGLVWLCPGHPLPAGGAVVPEGHGWPVSLISPLIRTSCLHYSKHVTNTCFYDEC